jgi:hypothetical protein
MQGLYTVGAVPVVLLGAALLGMRRAAHRRAR